MVAIEKGKTIQIPCKISNGVLPGEFGITVDTKNGPVSGFVRGEVLRGEDDDGYIMATVIDTQGDTIVVRLRGSFFTTNGIAYFTKSSLTEQLELA